MLCSSTIEIENTEELKKATIRDKVWNHIQKNGLANFPRIVYKRIPNFKGADEATEKLLELDCFKKANSIKVNLDKPQGIVRFHTLETGKTLYVPTPGLRTAVFNRLDNTSAGENTPEKLKLLAQNDGMKLFSKSVPLDEKVSVDLIVVGSVAVDKKGHRIGKGEGFVDLEYGMMRHLKAISDKTLIVTTVHDCQVFDDLPARLFEPHDVPVDIIVTPNEVIHIASPLKKPTGIIWELLHRDKFFRVAILKPIYQKAIENGSSIKLSTDEDVPTEEEIAEYWKKVEEEREQNRGARRGRGRGRGRGPRPRRDEDKDGEIVENGVEESEGRTPPRRGRGRGRGRGRRIADYPRQPNFSIFLGNVPSNSRTREIKEAVRDVISDQARGVEIQRRAASGYAFLRFNTLSEGNADELVEKLQGLEIGDKAVVVERGHDRPEEDGEQRRSYRTYSYGRGYRRGYYGRGRGGRGRGRGGYRGGRQNGEANREGEEDPAPEKQSDRRRRVDEESDDYDE